MPLSTGSALTNVYQTKFWDQVSCNITSPLPMTGADQKTPYCAWMIQPMFPFPIPNPVFPPEIISATTAAVIVTTTNVAMTIADEVTTGKFMLDWFIKTQFSYQYYGYIVMAVMPVMIVSNLLSIWVPMLPPIVFFLAVIGWVIAVIEAMIASPLILLGMTFPQGHDFLGSSQQALILLLGVFVRAPLIIIGFFAGMLILQITMVFLSVGVVPLVLNTFSGEYYDATTANAFMLYAFMVIFMYLTASVLTQALTITYKLPNTVVQWIGGSPPEGIEADAVRQIQSVVNQQQQGMLDSIKQAGMSAKSDQMAGHAGGGIGSAKKAGQLTETKLS